MANGMEDGNSFWNRRDFLKLGGASAAALGVSETASATGETATAFS